MSAKDAHLYGQRPKHRSTAKEISSSTTLAFTSQLSSLIASTSTNTANKPTTGRARPKKEDIFTAHNKNVKKRALKDLEDLPSTEQKHKGRTQTEQAEDDTTWRRAKRKMEEKARLYNAMKRGDIEDIDDKYGVDFDRKWAEKQEQGGRESDSDTSSDESEQEELIEYTDEFGRTRKGTRAQIAREQTRTRMRDIDVPDRFTARPSAPENIIIGDTIQTAAFNPDETHAAMMAELAAKRDKSLTPPPEEHFDGSREIRMKGTGFFHFSRDEEERRRQMGELEKEREETRRVREERKKKVEERRKMVAERKKVIQEKRAKGQAERFLDSLGMELAGGKEGEGG